MSRDEPNQAIPHVHKAGAGPAVVCLHSSTSSSKQWQVLIERLSQRYQVIAPDLYGYGKSPAWGNSRPLTLEDELALLRHVVDNIPGPFHLVGHSYGAAVAFKLALSMPARIRSVVAYEPVLFNLLFEIGSEHHAAQEVWAVQDDVRKAVAEGDIEAAGRRFVDYWSGNGVWETLLDWQRETIIKRMTKVVADFEATMGNPTPLSAYCELDIPTLYLYGVESPESTRTIAEWLGTHLPKVEVRGLLGMGHMGPVTHADSVTNLIERFIDRQPRGILVHQLKRSRQR